MGLTHTLEVFDAEMPRTAGCVNQRAALISALSLQHQLHLNKESSSPYNTVLEVITSCLLDDGSEPSRPTSAVRPQPGSSDVIVDDDVEGEAVLGEGRAGVFQASGRRRDELQHFTGLQPVPTKSSSRSRGMAKPISSGIQSDKVSRQWKMGPPLGPDNTQTKPPEERLSPPGRLQPLSDLQDTREGQKSSAASNGRRVKKKGKPPVDNEAGVQDALSKIRNARKRQPGSSFLANHMPLPSNPDLTNFSYNVSESSIGSAQSRGRRTSTDTSGFNSASEGAGVPSRDMYDEFCKGSKQKRKSRHKVPQSKRDFDLNEDEHIETRKRTFKRPGPEFNGGGGYRQQPQTHDNDLKLQSVSSTNISEQDNLRDRDNSSRLNDFMSDARSESSASPSEHASPSRDNTQRLHDENTTPRDSAKRKTGNSHGFKQLTAKQQHDDYDVQTEGDVTGGDGVTEGIDDMSLSPVRPVKTPPPSLKIHTSPMDAQTAVDLKRVIFGVSNGNFSDGWKYQSFGFSDLPHLSYGIVQKKDGPCGVLASVQTRVLEHLLFSPNARPSVKALSPSREKRSECLAAALASTLWRAGQETRAIVTLPSQEVQFHSIKFKADKFTETLMLHAADSYEHLLQFIKLNIAQFELDGTSGAVLCLYSAVLSRTVAGVRSDMDDAGGQLMGAYDYCSQEMVNLLLTGRAVSNVFNDTEQQDSESGHVVTLKGVSGRSDIGFLSLYEHYKSCQVGTYLKVPRRPVWVVCTESHFSVLFALNRDLLNNWRAERRFDLYYYDGLARQAGEVRLTIDTCNAAFRAPAEDDDVPPLELCIRTKWPDAEIDWNGTEPIMPAGYTPSYL